MLRYAITDRRMFPGNERDQQNALLAQARRLARAGVDLLQIREKDLPHPQLQALAQNLIEAVHNLATPRIRRAQALEILPNDPNRVTPRILLNGPAHIAAAVRADGVHLPSTFTATGTGTGTADAIEQARKAFAAAALPPPLLSLSCHSLEDIRAAAPLGLDYLLLGPIFEKRVGGTLISPGLGLDLLRQASSLTSPAKLIALGGVTETNTPACLHAGAAGVAGIRLFL